MLQAFLGSMPEHEPPCSAQTQRTNDWTRPQLRFIIAVPPHTVVAISLEIEQNTVEHHTRNGFSLCFEDK
jgi:hypothetical protein